MTLAPPAPPGPPTVPEHPAASPAECPTADEAACLARECGWRTENAGFIAAYNQGVALEGLPLAAWRAF